MVADIKSESPAGLPRNSQPAQKASAAADERRGWDNAAFDRFAGETSWQTYCSSRGREDGSGRSWRADGYANPSASD
jgi:hypothetical protein